MFHGFCRISAKCERIFVINSFFFHYQDSPENVSRLRSVEEAARARVATKINNIVQREFRVSIEAKEKELVDIDERIQKVCNP